MAGNQCDGNGTSAGTLGSGGSVVVQVAGLAGVPANAVATVATATVADTSAPSYLTVWPDGSARPTASDVNWPAGRVAPNLVVAKLGIDGAIDLYNASDSADTIVNVGGYCVPSG